jgi:hypothetical protein
MRRIFMAVLLCCTLHAQEHRVDARDTSPAEPATIPLHINKLIDLDPGLGAGLGLPIQCGSDARMYVRFFNEDGGDQAMVAIAPDGSTTHFKLPFDLGLENAVSLSLYATDDGVFVHILGQPSTKPVHYKTPSGGDIARKAGPDSHHLVVFDSDGGFKRRIDIDMPFKVFQVATFSSGMMLVAGLDSATGKPVVALGKEDGTFLRYITIKDDLSPDTFKPDESALRGMGTLDMKLQASSLIPDGREILLVRNETDSPVFVIAQSGEVRTVRVHAPNGHRVFSISPTQAGWMTQFVKDLGHGRFLSKLCSVDRNTGGLKQCYESEEQLGLGFACAEEGERFLFLKGGTTTDPNRSSLLLASEK